MMLTYPSFIATVKEPLQSWQDLNIVTSADSEFYYFCDALEIGSDNVTVAGPGGWGLDHALAAWSAFYREQYVPTRMSHQTPVILFSVLTTSLPSAQNALVGISSTYG